MIASIEPTIDPKQDAKFTILHTLTTARAPSPIVNLAWHASSTKQKSDMLASQTMDGDLRVWSVAKPPTAEMPKTIRILKRMDNVEPGRHWCSWSKNGRVLQFSDRYVGFLSYAAAVVPDRPCALAKLGHGMSERNVSLASQYQQSTASEVLRATVSKRHYSHSGLTAPCSNMIRVLLLWSRPYSTILCCLRQWPTAIPHNLNSSQVQHLQGLLRAPMQPEDP